MSRQDSLSTTGQLQCPQFPTLPHPNTHTRSGGWPEPGVARLGLPHWSCIPQQRVKRKTVGAEVVCSNRYTSAGVCVCVTLDCSIFLVHTRRLVTRPRNGGVLMSLNFIHPLHSSQIYSQTLPVFAGAWWEKVVYTWLLIGPEGIKEQAAGARVQVKLLFSVVFFIHMGHGLNGKGLK